MSNNSIKSEFDAAEIFRKLISTQYPQTALGRTQDYLTQIENEVDFIRELGDLCLKYGVGGISELEYHKEACLSYVTINWTYGRHRLIVRKSDDIFTIVRSIFAVVANAEK